MPYTHTHQLTHTGTCDLIYQGCWDRCLLVCWEVKVHSCVPQGKCAALERLCSTQLGVNILINGTVSLGTPHLLEYFSRFLAQVLHAAPAIIFIELWVAFASSV